jgi:hypothetical protein
MSTAPRDLAAIKHELELGLILAALIIATIKIVMAAGGDAGKLTPDITTGQGAAVMFTPAFAMLTGVSSSTNLRASGKRRARGRYESFDNR